MAKKRKQGRPKTPKSTHRKSVVTIKYHPREKSALAKLANDKGVKLSTMIREQSLEMLK